MKKSNVLGKINSSQDGVIVLRMVGGPVPDIWSRELP